MLKPTSDNNPRTSLPRGLLYVRIGFAVMSLWGSFQCLLVAEEFPSRQAMYGPLRHFTEYIPQACTIPRNASGDDKTHRLVFIEVPQAEKEPNPAFATIEDKAGLPRVLLIGDSISIGYTVPVQDALQGKANVHRPKTNCGPTTTAIAAIDEWLGDTPWDVIHFNWGLHDLKYMGPQGQNLADPDDPANHQQVPPEAYEKNLEQLVVRLKETGAYLIWRNTTPIPEGATGRVVGDSAKYNGIAEKVMRRHGIEIHDLYEFARKRQGEVMLPANVHFSKAGYEALAQDVAAVIMHAIETQKSKK